MVEIPDIMRCNECMIDDFNFHFIYSTSCNLFKFINCVIFRLTGLFGTVRIIVSKTTVVHSYDKHILLKILKY